MLHGRKNRVAFWHPEKLQISSSSKFSAATSQHDNAAPPPEPCHCTVAVNFAQVIMHAVMDGFRVITRTHVMAVLIGWCVLSGTPWMATSSRSAGAMTNSAQSDNADSFLRTVTHFTVIYSALRTHFNSNRTRTPRTSRDREPRIPSPLSFTRLYTTFGSPPNVRKQMQFLSLISLVKFCSLHSVHCCRSVLRVCVWWVGALVV